MGKKKTEAQENKPEQEHKTEIISLFPEDDGEKAALSAKIAAERASNNETETPPEEGDTDEELSDEEALAGISPEEEETETPPEEGDTAIEDKPVKTVPIDALHQERELRKAANAERDEARKLNQELLDFLKEQKKPDPEIDLTAPIEDFDAEILRNRKEIAELKQLLKKTQEESQFESHRRQQETLQKSLDATGIELEKEGFPGFQQFMPQLEQEFERIRKEDPELHQTLTNPTGWKKIYKETIYPTMNKLFAEQRKSRLLEQKKRLKADANLIENSGKPNVPKKETKPMTTEQARAEYVKFRQSQQLY